MPWRDHRRVDQREKFVLRASEPLRNMSELCREFGISRKTGYLWLERFEQVGIAGLEDKSRRPRRVVETSAEVVLRIYELRLAHPFWGPKKLRVLLLAELGSAPSAKTIARITRRLGLPAVRLPRRDKSGAERVGGALNAQQPNDVWTFDFKGWWETADGTRFEPLTVRDAASRFILLCVHCRETFVAVKEQCERLFRQYGLPRTIRADNGPPFGAIEAMGGLSRLSAWWVSLGIEVSFSRPGVPADNGGHERMHADMAHELERRPSGNTAAQQRAVDEWVRNFNYVRPHEALGMKTPGEVYRRSKRRLKVLEPRYPADAIVTRVSARGRITLERHQYFVGTNLSGMRIGLRRIDGKLHVLFFNLRLGVLASTPQRAR